MFGAISIQISFNDTRRNGQLPKSQLTKKLTQTYNDQNALVDIFSELTLEASWLFVKLAFWKLTISPSIIFINFAKERFQFHFLNKIFLNKHEIL